MTAILSISHILVYVGLVPLTLIFLLSKCFFLAPYRIGWVMMFANVIYETLQKKLRWTRWWMDSIGLVTLTSVWCFLLGPWAGIASGGVLGLAWAYTLLIDVQWRTNELAHQDRRFGVAAAPQQIPMPIPDLILTIRGPVLARGRIMELGDWPEGHKADFELMILNPSIIVPQWPLTVGVLAVGGGLSVVTDPSGEHKAPDSGQYLKLPLKLQAGRPGSSGEVRITVAHGDLEIQETLRLRSVVSSVDARPVSAVIRRWKGGAKAGFGWRGDHDLHDPSTFQSAEGLRKALEISRQFRLPSSLYLSGRLSLEPEPLKEFGEHFGFDRHPEDIPNFIEFLKNEVTCDPMLEFPYETPTKLAMELGNHMYLHYGTHAAVDPGNDWTWRAEMGKGTYPWQSEATDSFSEQRDNARHNLEVIRDMIGVTIQSWGVPGRANDPDTGRALEAAGMVVASDSDAPAWTNVMKLEPPHHPAGCENLVEISKKYPGDCNNIYKIAMLDYWLNAARRTGRVFLYMAHHHLLMYEGTSCYQLTRAFFHHALSVSKGDLYVATVSALGLYWERVLCPDHRWVSVSVVGDSVVVNNTGNEALEGLPLEIEMANGARYMMLVDVGAGVKVKR